MKLKAKPIHAQSKYYH